MNVSAGPGDEFSGAESKAADLRRSSDTHRVIKGRRWRVSDPALDEFVRQHLVDELMDARRAVKAALNGNQAIALEEARSRVHDAKIALGERGPGWSDPLDGDDADLRVASFIRAIVDRVGDVDAQQARILLRIPPSS